MSRTDSALLRQRPPTRAPGRGTTQDNYRRALEQAGNTMGNYRFIANIQRFRHQKSTNLLTESALLNLLGHTIPDKMPIAKALYSDALGILQYASLTFAPGQPEHLVNKGQLELNAWTPTEIVPSHGGPAPFVRLVKLIFDDDQIGSDFFLNAIAFLVQKPGLKWHFMILIIGAQGIGKSILLEIVAVLVGRQNAVFPTIDALRGQFTGWMTNAQVILFHELERTGREAATRLKNWITSETLMINAKNVPEFSIPNCVNILACANHDDVAMLDQDDRRTFTWISQAEKQPPEYYAAFCDWFFNGDGKAIVLDFLLSRDLSGFNPKVAPPRTAGRERLIANSRSEAERFLQDALESEAPPFVSDLCVAADVLQFLRVNNIRCSYAEVQRFLRDAGALSIGQRRVNGTRPNLWAVRNQNFWQSATYDDVVDHYVPVFEQYRLQQDRANAAAGSAPMPTRARAPLASSRLAAGNTDQTDF